MIQCLDFVRACEQMCPNVLMRFCAFCVHRSDSKQMVVVVFEKMSYIRLLLRMKAHFQSYLGHTSLLLTNERYVIG